MTIDGAASATGTNAKFILHALRRAEIDGLTAIDAKGKERCVAVVENDKFRVWQTRLRGESLTQSARDRRDQEALNTEALRKIWDNDVDAIYDAIDWRTGKREKAKVSAR